jgi:hypothetical protein
VTIVLWHAWTTKDGRDAVWEAAMNVVPSLLGFSIGAMAIVLAFSGSKFFGVLAERGREDSAYINLTAMFVHFSIVQSAAIIFALISRLQPDSILLGFLATFSVIYGLATAVATALALFGMARIYNTIVLGGDQENTD